MSEANRKARSSWWPVVTAALTLAAVAVAAVGYQWLGGPVSTEGKSVGGPSPEAVRKAHRSAEHYIQRDQPAKAKTILKALIEQRPSDAQAHVLMAKALMAEGPTENAYEHARRAAELAPRRADARFLAARLADQTGRLEEARTHYETAVSIQPGTAKYRLYLSQLLLRMNDLEKARWHALKARQSDSSLPAVHGVLAEVAARNGEPGKALERVNNALEEVSDQPERKLSYMLLKAQLLRRTNEPRAAVRLLRELPVAQQQKPKAVEQLAQCYLMLGEPAKAAAVWMELSARQPTNAEAAARAGLCYLRAGNAEHARQYLKRAKQIDPDADHVRSLAEALAQREG